MTDSFLRSALNVLETGESTPLRTAAANALLTAAHEGVRLPDRAAWSVWTWLQTVVASGTWVATDQLAEIDDPRVRSDALELLRSDTGTDDARRFAGDVLCGPGHAPFIDDRELLDLADRARGVAAVDRLCGLLEAVHRARGVPVEILRGIRDRWGSSRNSEIRQAAVRLSATFRDEPEVLDGFVERMLGDAVVDVRVSIAREIEFGLTRTEAVQRGVESRLRVETHPEAQAALLRAQAAFQEDRTRRQLPRHRWPR